MPEYFLQKVSRINKENNKLSTNLIILDGTCSGVDCTRDNCPRWEMSGGNYPATEILFLSSIKTTLPNIVGVCECLNLIA